MKKCIELTKYFRSHPSHVFVNGFVSGQKAPREGGRGPPAGRGEAHTRPPFPSGLIVGVCGRINHASSERNIFVIAHDHSDEIAAVANAQFYLSAELFERLKETRPYLFHEKFDNRFIMIREWAKTEHIGWLDLPDGAKKLGRTKSYCYRFDPEWLEAKLSFKTSSAYAYIDESFEAGKLIQKARAEGAVPLFHWQSRQHINAGYTITAQDLPDGYMLDNRIRMKDVGDLGNVLGKCVPSLLDVKMMVCKENPYCGIV